MKSYLLDWSLTVNWSRDASSVTMTTTKAATVFTLVRGSAGVFGTNLVDYLLSSSCVFCFTLHRDASPHKNCHFIMTLGDFSVSTPDSCVMLSRYHGPGV